MVLGLFLALIAGSLVGLQNVFNAKVNRHTGTWTTTTLVLGLGFAASFMIGMFADREGMTGFLPHMQTWFWFSGLIGVGVVTCMVQGMRLLGPTFAVAITMTSQLGLALLFDTRGWLGLQQVPFTLHQLIGVLVFVAGIFVFKLGGARERLKETVRRPGME
ncbi:DMT family transporter [Paenibacillus cisolokensis]|uniref:DMT family transporter n=1 Tax=Paenibacillus cisolokensis TaxID=1658519 RepID=UPI003D2D6AFE